MIGQSIAHYKITELIGAGGMGEVYRATDTRLSRDVALKVLPEAFARDEQRMARFAREAQVLASLNHPNIAAIYGLEEAAGKRALVLELVEGETLDERIERGALPLDVALKIALQIAEGLEAAHELGVIHRDLKPANVKITPSGAVKVLDFGLAKALAREASPDPGDSPTLTAQATGAGMILGTAGYMAAEQAKGDVADRRADIWSFGVVLFEMLTGGRLFVRASVAETLAAVLNQEPDWDQLGSTPAAVRELIRRCLRRDPRSRLRDIGDARVALEDYLADPTLPAAPGEAPLVSSRLLPAGVAIVMAALGIWLGSALFAPVLPGAKAVRLTLSLPLEQRLMSGDALLAMSPDGSTLVYQAFSEGQRRLFSRRLDSFESTLLPGTAGAHNPFFSPDGNWIGFFNDEKMLKVPASGGKAVELAEAQWGHGSWGPDGLIVYTPYYGAGLWRIPADGGRPEQLTTPDSSRGVLGHWWPDVLPGGQAVLYTDFTTPVETAHIAVLSLTSGEQRTLVEGGTFARYASSGHLLYVDEGTLMATPFDPGRLEVTGPAAPVLEDMPVHASSGHSQYSIARDGTLAFIPASIILNDRMLVRVDRQGVVEEIQTARRHFEHPSVSADGRRIAVSLFRDVFLCDVAGGALTRLTFQAFNENVPIWSPDGSRIVFRSEQPVFDLYWKPADGSAQAEPLLTGEFDKHPAAFSPDGELVVYTESHPETLADIWVVPVAGERRPLPFLRTAANEGVPRFSPDGRWLVYESDESGRFEIYVQAFPGPGGKWQVSDDGGRAPVWSRDGRELFYRAGNRLMAASVRSSGSGISAGEPRVLFEGKFVYDDTTVAHPGYDVTPEGDFIMVKTPPGLEPRQVSVILNWFEELERLAPLN